MVIKIAATTLGSHLHHFDVLGTVMALEEVRRVGDAKQNACVRAFAALPPVPRRFVARGGQAVGTGWCLAVKLAERNGARACNTPTASVHKSLSQS